jgi:tungstate transport system ATP-binding protein
MIDKDFFQVRNLTFAYEPGQPVLDIPELSIEKNRVTVFAGGNGSGKTTFLKLLNGLLTPGEGEITYKGRKLHEEGYRILRKETVLVHQNPYLFSGTVFQNVAYGLKIRKTDPAEIRARVSLFLSIVGLDGFETRKSGNLSGGERQRVALARALAIEPEAILLDEPTANVDTASTILFETFISAMKKKGKTIILSTHNKAFAYRTCDRLIQIDKGMIKGREENIFKGRVESQDDRFTLFKTGPLTLKCPAQKGSFSTAVLPLDDVILSPDPIQTSAQNNCRGKVIALTRENGLFRVTLDAGIIIETYITGYSTEELGVAKDKEFYITFKAAALKLY